MIVDAYYSPVSNSTILVETAKEGMNARELSQPKPYFYTDADEGLLKWMRDRRRILSYEPVSKFHPIRRKRVTVFRAYTNTPADVRSVRDYLKRKGFRAWEADIEYPLRVLIHNLLWPASECPADCSFEDAINSIGDHRLLTNNAVAFDIEVGTETASSFPQSLSSPEEYKKDLQTSLQLLLRDSGKWLKWAEERAGGLGRVADKPVIAVGLSSKEGTEVILLRRRVLSLSLHDLVVKKKPEEDVCPEDSWTVELEDGTTAKVTVVDAEEELLAEVWRRLREKRVWITYNGDQFDIPYLFYRSVRLGVVPAPLVYVKMTYSQHVHAVPYGGTHIDLYEWFSNSTVQNYVHGKAYSEYSLDAVARAVLGIRKFELDEGQLPSSLRCRELSKYSATDARITYRLFEHDAEIMLMLSAVTRLPLSWLTTSGVSKWVKQILLWEYTARNMLLPAKEELDYSPIRTSSKTGKQYSGAYVKDPPVGMFFDVLDVDFASLYPSIIEVYNIGPETVDNPYVKCSEIYAVVEPETGETIHSICMDFRSVVAETISHIKALRLKYKRMKKDRELPEEVRRRADVIQSALKVIINASYGVLGNSSFSLYLPGSAESVTTIGRRIILDMIRFSESQGVPVLYTDTDSMFLWKPPKEALNRIFKYAEEVHGVQLDVDAEFTWVLFSGLKKNYVARKPDGSLVVKGFVGKKSNTPPAIRRLFMDALSKLAEAESPEDLISKAREVERTVAEFIDDLYARRIPAEQLAFSAQLSRELNEYKSKARHVKVAERVQTKYGVRFSKGDRVYYIESHGGPVHLIEVKLGKVQYDAKKYTEVVRSVFEQLTSALSLRLERSRDLEAILVNGSRRGKKGEEGTRKKNERNRREKRRGGLWDYLLKKK